MSVRHSLLAFTLITPSLLALPAHAEMSDAALLAAGIISRSQAVAIAEAAVPNAKLVAAAFEKTDHPPHWSVDLLGSVYEYEVWVSTGGRVLRVITQPK